jgi:hypothetical protein
MRLIDLPSFLHHLGHPPEGVSLGSRGISFLFQFMVYQATSLHLCSLGPPLLPHKIPSTSGLPSSLVPALYGCEMSNTNWGNVEIHEHEIPGLEDAGSPKSMLVYEAIEITNYVVPYSFSITNSAFQNPQLILIPCQSLSQSLSLESITCIQPCFRSIIDIAENAFDTAIDKPW